MPLHFKGFLLKFSLFHLPVLFFDLPLVKIVFEGLNFIHLFLHLCGQILDGGSLRVYLLIKLLDLTVQDFDLSLEMSDLALLLFQGVFDLFLFAPQPANLIFVLVFEYLVFNVHVEKLFLCFSFLQLQLLT